MAKIKENKENKENKIKEDFLHPDFPGEITGEMVIKENQTHRDDIMNGMDLCSAILYHHAKKHDLDKNVPENAEVLAKAINTGDFTDWNEIHCYKQMHHYQCFMQSDKTNLFDLLECVVDGVVANKRREGQEKTFDEEYKFFIEAGFDEFMAKGMANTFMSIQKLIRLEKAEDPKDI